VPWHCASDATRWLCGDVCTRLQHLGLSVYASHRSHPCAAANLHPIYCPERCVLGLAKLHKEPTRPLRGFQTRGFKRGSMLHLNIVSESSGSYESQTCIWKCNLKGPRPSSLSTLFRLRPSVSTFTFRRAEIDTRTSWLAGMNWNSASSKGLSLLPSARDSGNAGAEEVPLSAVLQPCY
jgi:hypothetical protein